MPLQDHMQIISVDDHLIEHPRVFTDRLAARYLADGPRIVEDEKGRHIWHFETRSSLTSGSTRSLARLPSSTGLSRCGSTT